MAKRVHTSGCLIVLLLPVAFLLGRCTEHRDAPETVALPTERSDAAASLPDPPAPDSRYVDATTLNQRASPNGPVVGRLDLGASVEVHARESGWARISRDGEPERWVFEKRLCAGEGCAVHRTVAAATRLARPGTARPADRRRVDSDGSCPCSSAHNCFGPRGGRYCITSGGNKRYR